MDTNYETVNNATCPLLDGVLISSYNIISSYHRDDHFNTG